MNSWKLFKTLIPLGERPTDITPIFIRERFDGSLWPRFTEFTERIPPVLVLLLAALYVGALVFSGSSQAPFCLNGMFLLLPLLMLMPSLLVWALPIGLALAPIIARERESRSWEVLRATPFDSQEIMLSKARGAMWSLRQSLYRLWSVQGQVLVALVVGGGIMILFSNIVDTSGDFRPADGNELMCMSLMGMILVGGIGYVCDRAQQLTLMVTAALAVSANAHKLRTALTGAVAASFLMWSIDAAAGILILIFQPHGVVTDLSFSVVITILLGPLAGYLIELDPLRIAVAISVTYLVRELTIRGLWMLAVSGAKKMY